MYKRSQIDIEYHFNKFVKEFGGNIISEQIVLPPTFKNADYLFKTDKIVVELKCLKKNIFEDSAYIYKLSQLFTKWYFKGWIDSNSFFQWTLGNQNLPNKCQIDYIKLAKPLLEDTIRKANKQLRETIENLKLDDYEGLVIIINDGNYAIENNHFYRLIGNILNLHKFKDSNVDGYVYTTVNMPSLNSKGTVDAGVWSPSYRGDDKKKLSDFVNRLGYAWLNYHNKYIEKKDIKVIQTNDGDIIKDMKFLPKDFPRDQILWEKDETS